MSNHNRKKVKTVKDEKVKLGPDPKQYINLLTMDPRAFNAWIYFLDEDYSTRRTDRFH